MLVRASAFQKGANVMRSLHAIVISTCLLVAAPSLASAQAAPTREQQAYQVVQDWATALDSHDVNRIVAKYADPPDVLFFGTKATILATTTAEIRNYFVHFVEEEPAVSLCEHKTIKISDKAFLFAGFYDFNLKTGPVYARYTFLMLNFPGGWRIAHHHSAAQPAGAQPCLRAR